MIPNNQYEQDIAICEAASEGLWEKYEARGVRTHPRVTFAIRGKLDCVADYISKSDACFMETFNPQRVIQLLERQRGLEEEAEAAQKRIIDLELMLRKILNNTKSGANQGYWLECLMATEEEAEQLLSKQEEG